MTLGGTIFNDADNSSTFQSGTESTFNSVALTLFEDEGNGVFDGTETQLDITGSLAGTDPDDDVDNDDNGTHLGATTTAVVSQAITLINNS